ncbi:MAG: DUF4340 domain-containing protein [Desulfomonilaceae bacterium]
MKLGKLLIYLTILVALAAYVYFVEIRHKQEQQAIEEKAAKIVHLEKDKVVEIELLSRNKEKIELKKPSDTWVLTSPIKTKADASAVASLLLSITDAKPDKVVLEKGVKWDDYALDKPEFTVTLATKDQTAEIRFGSANPAKTSYYLRVDEQPKLLLVPDTLKTSLNKSAFDLRDKTVVSLSPDQVDRIAISAEGKEIELQRQTADRWTMVKPERFLVKAPLIAGNLRTLTNLTAKGIIDEPAKDGDPYGLDNPQEAILIAGKEREQTLLVGAPEKKEGGPPGAEPDRYARIKGQETVYVLDGRALKSLKTAPDELRDRSLLTFNPADIEKMEISLDGKTWLAAKDKDNKWSLEQPEKKEKLDAWPVTSILWDLKDLQWKSITKPAPADLASVHLDKPQLMVSLFRKGESEPLLLKAGWPAVAEKKGHEEGAKKENQPASPEEQRSAEKKIEAPAKGTAAEVTPDKAAVPEKINVLAQPHDEQGAMFAVDGGLVSRLRTDLERLTEKK